MDINEFWKQLDKVGPEKVRQNISAEVYSPEKKAMAYGWLQQKDQEKTDSDSAASAVREERMISISASAKNAAWIAAIAAIVAAIAAIVAITLHIQ